MDDMVKIKVTVSTNKVGSECVIEEEIPREEWDEMSEDDRQCSSKRLY